MSTPKTVKRLVACFGSIQLITALSVLSHREKEQQELNLKYENYLVITPLWAPRGQNDEFAAFIEKMARSFCSWEKIVYIPLEQIKSIAKDLNSFGLSGISNEVHELLGLKNADEIYLSREYKFEDQLLMNVYESAEKICYGNGIGIYTCESAFPRPSSFKKSHKKSPGYLKYIYNYLQQQLKILISQNTGTQNTGTQNNLLTKQEFDLGYFSLPSAFGQVPTMKTVTLDRAVYLQIFQRLRRTLGSLIDVKYVNDLRTKLQNVPTSILLTSNFSEASGRMSLENEIAAYREFLENQGIEKNSILLIKPHPRDSKNKILKLKSALSELYSEIILLNEEFLFYLPFELFFMDVFLNSEQPTLQVPRIFTFSSACLTLELVFNIECIFGFGSNIVEKFFYQDHIAGRIKHEADLIATVREIKNLNACLV